MTTGSTRREALGVIAGSGLVVRQTRSADIAADAVPGDLARYLDLGSKASGGPGDEACGAWLEARLQALGYATRRQAFQVPLGETSGALTIAGVETPMWCAPTQSALTVRGAPLAHVDDPRGAAGGIAVARLAFRRWSSATAPLVQQAIARAHDAGARALVLVTEGPTGETIALNVPAGDPPPIPIATVGSRLSGPLMAAAWRREPCDGRFGGRVGDRSAFNVIGEAGAEGLRLVISTPRSGWFACGGERGPGVAVWLALAGWAAAARGVRVTFLATSGHEFEGLGVRTRIQAVARLALECRAGPGPRSLHP